jgi:ABC-2 type transport system ATP-binding protein
MVLAFDLIKYATTLMRRLVIKLSYQKTHRSTHIVHALIHQPQSFKYLHSNPPQKNTSKVSFHALQKTVLAVVSLLSISLVGCSTVDIHQLHADTDRSTPLEQRYYHVDIPSFDGTLLKATVFQPALHSYERAPLVIHSHGWATWRMKGKVGLHGTFMVHGKAGLKAWEQGYWVISFDHRGFGSSEGKVNIMDPDIEVKDAIAVIDWAAENLPRLAFDDVEANDPKVGMLGESYGGQMQLLASIQDPRIDAIVPMTTWHDLSEAIAPGGHVKSFWSTIFFGFGTLTSFF